METVDRTVVKPIILKNKWFSCRSCNYELERAWVNTPEKRTPIEDRIRYCPMCGKKIEWIE